MVLIPEFSLLLHVLSDVSSLVIVLSDLLDELLDGSIVLGNLLLQHIDLLILVLLGLSALFHLHIAPIFVIIFVLLLTHEAENHLLDHLLDLIKWAIVGADLLCQFL